MLFLVEYLMHIGITFFFFWKDLVEFCTESIWQYAFLLQGGISVSISLHVKGLEKVSAMAVQIGYFQKHSNNRAICKLKSQLMKLAFLIPLFW